MFRYLMLSLTVIVFSYVLMSIPEYRALGIQLLTACLIQNAAMLTYLNFKN